MSEHNSKKRIWLIILAVLFVLAVVVFLIFKLSTPKVDPNEIYGYEAEEDDVERIAGDVADEQAPLRDGGTGNTDGLGNADAGTDAADGGSDTDSTPTYYSPIDFLELARQNTDITGWLRVPGTSISYPVCQHPTDDAYYLNHNSNNELDINGAIFTEATYNSGDFSDPVTVVYGHNMKSGKMFGYLEETFRDGFEGHDEAIIYMPDGEIHYKLFAVMPVQSGHLLDGAKLEYELVFNNFAYNIMSNKDMSAIIDHSVDIEYGDRLLILSTCMGGDKSHRYIVVGKRVSEKSNDPNRRMDKAD